MTMAESGFMEEESTPSTTHTTRKEVQTPPPPQTPPKQEQDLEKEKEQELEQLRISSEYDEDRELRAKNMPTIYSFASKTEQFHYMYGDDADEQNITKQFGPIHYREGLKPVLATPNFNISDIHIRDAKGLRIVGTFAVIWINPFGQVLPLEITIKDIEKEKPDYEKEKRIIYEVLFGQGHLTIGNLTRRIFKSDIFWVEPGVEHNFFNTSSQPLIVRLFYDGHVDLRDRYFPKQRQQQVAKESRREIFDVRQQKNVPVESTSTSTNTSTNTKPKPAISRAKSEQKFA